MLVQREGVLEEEKDQLSVIIFAPHKRKNCLRSLNCFEIILVDGTSNVHKVGMPLYFFLWTWTHCFLCCNH